MKPKEKLTIETPMSKINKLEKLVKEQNKRINQLEQEIDRKENKQSIYGPGWPSW